MSIRLKEVADELGISISTVSRALNESTSFKVKPSTQSLIHNTIQELENRKAIEKEQKNIRSLNSIGIILASPDKSFSHLFFAEMFNFLQDQIYNHDYHIKYVLSESSMSKSKFYDAITNIKVSGAIILGWLDKSFLDFCKKNIPNLVYTGVNYIGQDTDEVICNGYDAIQTLYKHFFDIGYRKIAYIGPTNTDIGYKNNYHRFLAFKECIKIYNVPASKVKIQKSSDTFEEGYMAMHKILSANDLPEAIICTSDNCALGAIRAAFEKKILIPEDIAIAGIDNISISEYSTPGLTTINVPKAELSRLSVNMLIDKIEHSRKKNIRLDIPYDLIIRESCGYHLYLKQ